MKRYIRIILAVCMAFFLAVQTALSAAAYGAEEIFSVYTEDKSSFFEDIEFGDNDWAALCYIRLYGTEGAEGYLDSVERAAQDMMSSERFVKPTDLQRAAIILSAAGRCSEELICAAVYNNDKFDRQGMNAYVWGLIAANCSDITEPENTLNTVESLMEYLISKQLQDGGFSLKGSAADTDMTASVIYALAPHMGVESVAAAVVRAEQCLRALQLESGGYSSMNVENCESVAQAVIAFTALDCGEDDIQVNKALDAMLAYRREGGYAHLPDGEADGIATVQALLALTSLELLGEGKALYELSDEPYETVEQSASSAVQESDDIPIEPDTGLTGDGIRYIIGGVLIGAGVIAMIILLAIGRKKLLLFPVLLCVSGIVVFLLDVRTPDEYYSSAASDGIRVTVTVDCSEALAYELPLDLPENGAMLSCGVTVPDGATAFDALIEAAKSQQLKVEHTGSAFGEYVQGIGGLYEFDCGSESGWLYSVNSERPSVSAGAYTLSEGDVVEFIYTCSLGAYPQ